MATVNFSVPEEVKRAFNQAFAGENKSAVIAKLMQRAVEERETKERRKSALEALLSEREHKQPVSDDEVAETRRDLRQ